jgi:hypothetical protein
MKCGVRMKKERSILWNNSTANPSFSSRPSLWNTMRSDSADVYIGTGGLASSKEVNTLGSGDCGLQDEKESKYKREGNIA